MSISIRLLRSVCFLVLAVAIACSEPVPAPVPTPISAPAATSTPLPQLQTPTKTPVATLVQVPSSTPAPTVMPALALPTPELRSLTAKELDQLSAYIEENRELYNVPGVAVVVVQDGEVMFAEGFGVKEAGGTDPVNPDTVFSIASLTKPMTSMMTATLVDEGLIDWDTPVVEVMPQFQLSDADATGQITLRHLFAHTTGLPDVDLALFAAGLSPEGLVEFLKGVPLNSRPGDSMTYQNQAYALGGYVATMAVGGGYGDNLVDTYIDLMQTRVFDPIGMSTVTFSAEKVEASPNHATPHYITLNGTLAQTGFDITPTHYWDIGGSASAYGARASAMDMGRFLITMLADGVAPDGTRVVSGQNLAETWTQQIEINAEPFLEDAGEAFGWNLEDYQGVTVVTKISGIGGFSAQMGFVPGADTGIVVLTNVDTMGLPLSRNVQYRLVEMLYGLEPKLEEYIEVELGQIAGLGDGYAQLLPVDPDSIAPYLGKYESLAGHPYSIEWRDGGLWFSQGPLDYAQLLASPDGGYAGISPKAAFYLPFQFTEGEDGSVTLVIAGAIEAPKLGAGDLVTTVGTYEANGESYAADIATLFVPENRDISESRLVELPVIRVRALSDNPTEPIFVLAGGPGGSNMRFTHLSGLIDDHDIVMVGYRGADGSVLLSCPEVSEARMGIGNNLFSEESLTNIGSAFTRCASRMQSEGIDLEGYTMPEVVEDMEAARTALGYDRINLNSQSYGTRVAMIYAWTHPDSIYRSAMIAVNPPGRFVWEPDVVDEQIAYDAELCARDLECSSRTDDLVETMRNVAHDLPDNWNSIPIDPGKVKIMTHFGLFHRGGAAMVYDAYLTAEEGDPSGLAMMSQIYDSVIPTMATWGEWAAKAATDYDQSRDYLTEMFPPDSILGAPATMLGGPATSWPVNRLPAELRQVRRSDVETLLVSGNADYSTPPQFATDELLPFLSNGEQVILSEFGHTGDVWGLQPEATVLLLTSFYNTGMGDNSLFIYQPMDFHVDVGFPEMAKQ